MIPVSLKHAIHLDGNCSALNPTPVMARVSLGLIPCCRELLEKFEMSTERNAPCPCGSGKKYKKCCLGHSIKPRTTWLKVDMEKPVILKEISISSYGEINMFGDNRKPLPHVSASVVRSYARPKGAKILSRVPLDGSAILNADLNQTLLQFNRIFAIDSNSQAINGHNVSVAAITLGTWVEQDSKPILEYASTQAMEFRDIDCHPDLLALKQFLTRLPQHHPRIFMDGRIGIVIDSHLRDLPRIEARDIPLLDDFFLPEWATLIYASDAASDSIPNILLRNSDKSATAVLKQIERGDWIEESQEQFFDHGTYFRIWEFKGRTNEAFHPTPNGET